MTHIKEKSKAGKGDWKYRGLHFSWCNQLGLQSKDLAVFGERGVLSATFLGQECPHVFKDQPALLE